MNIQPQQIINPGAYAYDDERRKLLADYGRAVANARFLSEDEKLKWKSLRYYLNNRQLEESLNAIIAENLKKLYIKEQLETLKPINV